MMRFIVLDSTPLGLIAQRRGFKLADECRNWLEGHLDAGTRAIVPEIVHYEIRRELIRLGKAKSLAALEVFCESEDDRFLPLNSKALRLAAELWADARRHGAPTADRHALDVDVILAAQILAYGLKSADFIVATANVAHLARFVPAELWSNI